MVRRNSFSPTTPGVVEATPGSVLLDGPTLRALGRHLAHVRESDDPTTRVIVRRIVELSRMSRARQGDLGKPRFVPDTFGDLSGRVPASSVNTAEAADRLGITTDAVRKRIARGTLAAHRDGRVWRIPAAQLEGDTSGEHQILARKVLGTAPRL